MSVQFFIIKIFYSCGPMITRDDYICGLGCRKKIIGGGEGARRRPIRREVMLAGKGSWWRRAVDDVIGCRLLHLV